MFLRRIFFKALWGSGRAPLLRFDKISFGSFKIWSSRTDLLLELWKESGWLTSWLCSGIELLTPETAKLFSLPKAVLPLLSALYHPAAIKILKYFNKFYCPRFFQMNFAFIQMSFSINGVSVVNKSDITFTTHIDKSAVYYSIERAPKWTKHFVADS